MANENRPLVMEAPRALGGCPSARSLEESQLALLRRKLEEATQAERAAAVEWQREKALREKLAGEVEDYKGTVEGLEEALKREKQRNGELEVALALSRQANANLREEREALLLNPAMQFCPGCGAAFRADGEHKCPTHHFIPPGRTS